MGMSIIPEDQELYEKHYKVDPREIPGTDAGV